MHAKSITKKVSLYISKVVNVRAIISINTYLLTQLFTLTRLS